MFHTREGDKIPEFNNWSVAIKYECSAVLNHTRESLIGDLKWFGKAGPEASSRKGRGHARQWCLMYDSNAKALQFWDCIWLMILIHSCYLTDHRLEVLLIWSRRNDLISLIFRSISGIYIRAMYLHIPWSFQHECLSKAKHIFCV